MDWPVTERVGTERILLWLFAIVGIEKRQDAWAESLKTRERLVEAVLSDQRRIADVALAAHVPLAEVAGCVAGVVQNAGKHRRLRIEPLGHAASFILFAVVQERRDLPASRILAG